MNSPGGYVYILYGEDTFGRDEAVVTLKERMRSLPAGEYNLTELGPETTVAALRQAADVVPFLADRRMVFVRGMLARLAGGGEPRRTQRRKNAVEGENAEDEFQALLDYLPNLPQTTSLVLVEGGRRNPARRNELLLRDLRPVKPVSEGQRADARRDRTVVVHLDALLVAIPGGRAMEREYPRVVDREVPGWVRGRAKSIGVDLDEAAVRELAMLGGSDLRRLDSELRKLADYAAGRNVTRADVRELVVGREVQTWALLDGLAERQADKALRALRALFSQGESPEALLGRDIAPHYRRLMVARELSLASREERARVDVAALGLNPATVGKWTEQAAAFERHELERALELLLDLDRHIKTGETSPEPSLELAVVQLCSRLASASPAA